MIEIQKLASEIAKVPDFLPRLTAEAKLFNCIKRLILLSHDIRTDDILQITDRIDKILCEMISTMANRLRDTSPRHSQKTREADYHLDYEA